MLQHCSGDPALPPHPASTSGAAGNIHIPHSHYAAGAEVKTGEREGKEGQSMGGKRIGRKRKEEGEKE